MAICYDQRVAVELIKQWRKYFNNNNNDSNRKYDHEGHGNVEKSGNATPHKIPDYNDIFLYPQYPGQ